MPACALSVAMVVKTNNAFLIMSPEVIDEAFKPRLGLTITLEVKMSNSYHLRADNGPHSVSFLHSSIDSLVPLWSTEMYLTYCKLKDFHEYLCKQNFEHETYQGDWIRYGLHLGSLPH